LKQSLKGFMMKNTIKFIAAKALNTRALVILIVNLGVFLSFAAMSQVAKDNFAEVTVKDAWIRTSVPGQKATGAFMAITAKANLKLVGASSPVAGIAELHEMKMDGDIMRMRAVQGGLDLPAGKMVELKPGSFHIMLLDLKTALPKDTTVPVTLLFKDAKGVESKVALSVPVATVAPGAKAASGAAIDMNQHKH
jgi:copper(I)-binding protein